MNISLEKLFDLEKGLSKYSPDHLKDLSKKGELFWSEKKIVVDIFSKADFFYDIQTVGAGKAHIEGKVRLHDRIVPLKNLQFVSPLGVLEGYIFCFFDSAIEWKWVKNVLISPLLLEGLHLKSFIEELEEKNDAPPFAWENRPQQLEPPPTPLLVLTDKTGGFADLWMDYGSFGRIDIHTPDRKWTDDESFWEQNLLETDFVYKVVGASHYYCPLDKVGKSLTFLLELGWIILDALGRTVVRQNGSSLSCETLQDSLIVRGKITYGEHDTNLENLVGAFNRKDRFVELSPLVVGLVEMPPQWTFFSEEEIVKEGVCIKRTHFNLLENVVKLPQEYLIHEWAPVLPSPSFQGALYPYQQKGLDWLNFLYTSSFHGLLADEMGLGKTVQLLAFFSLLKSSSPVLIIVPTSLIFNWVREFAKFLPHANVLVHHGKNRLKCADFLQKQSFIITSYATARLDGAVFEKVHFEAVILDEAQVIKNAQSFTAQFTGKLKANFRLAITGTPVENRMQDLVSLFDFLMPDLLGNDSSIISTESVKKKITPFILRRLKKEVAPYLPEKQQLVSWIELSPEQREFYDAYLMQSRGSIVQKVKENGTSKSRFEILEVILRLRQICCHPLLVDTSYEGESAKVEALMLDVSGVLMSGHKVLIYSQFTQMLKLIEKELQRQNLNYLYLDGKTKNREELVDQFQTDPQIPVFLISLKAGGVGLNLTAADYVFVFDPWWNESAENQAIDRAHRIGREGSVTAKRYVTVGTIEEKIMALKELKQNLSNNLLDLGDDFASFSVDDLYELLN